jgi:hypothetical protein
MFRRKTDQVYATLQQVQRRITERSISLPSSGPSAPEAHQLQAQPVYPFDRPEAAPLAEPAPGDLTAPSAPPGRRTLQLSPELASTVVVLWLLSIVIAYFLGTARAARPPEASAGYAPGPAGQRDPSLAASSQSAVRATNSSGSAVPGSGKDVLILKSANKVTDEYEQDFGKKAARLNEVASKNVELGLRPWFGVRKPSSGGIQLVYGALDGKFGVNSEDFAELDKRFAKEKEYDGAHWMTLSDR